MSKVSEHLSKGGNNQPQHSGSAESRPLHAANLAFYLRASGRRLDDLDIAALRAAADIISYPEADNDEELTRNRIASYELTMSNLVPVRDQETATDYVARLIQETTSVATTLRELADGNPIDEAASAQAESFTSAAYSLSRQGYLFK